MKHIKLYLSILAFMALVGCADKEGDLLQSKIYFESKQMKVEVEDTDTYDFELLSRLSKGLDNDVNVEYQIADESYVEAYNKKYGTSFIYMPSANYSLATSSSVIKSGKVYAEPCKLSLKGLSSIEEGNTYLIPVILKSSNVAALSGSDVSYIVVRKPFTIRKVYDFNGRYLDVQLPISAKNINSVTYEALIYIDRHIKLSTIMGNEGILLFRFGDTTVDADQIQIAGNVQFNPTKRFELNRWYHVAFVYDASAGKATIYINGEKEADKEAKGLTFDLNQRFCIGYAYDYDPGRVWRGRMSECRLWTVARTAAQIRDNMMGIDPNTEGLLGYWKLNGDDYENRNGAHYVKDQTKNRLDAQSRSGRRGEDNNYPGSFVVPQIVDMKVELK